MALNQGAGVAGVGFAVHHPRGVGIQNRVVFDRFVARQANHGLCPILVGDGFELNDFLVIGQTASGRCRRRFATRHFLIRILVHDGLAGLVEMGRILFDPALRHLFDEMHGAADALQIVNAFALG